MNDPNRNVEASERDGLQTQAYLWVVSTFGVAVAQPRERAMRFIEEAIELAQAAGITFDEVARLVTYVFSRPVGEPAQEVGGVGVTLLSYCESVGLSANAEEQREHARVLAIDPEHFRRKHNTKSDAGVSTTRAKT